MPADEKTEKACIIKIPKSTLETIDRALFKWAKDDLDIFANYPDGWKKVPVLWLASGRAFQSKHDKDLRDSNGNLLLPLMTVERLSVSKEPTKKGAFYGNILPDSKNGTVPAYQVGRRINQVQTSKYSAAQNTIEGTRAPFTIRRNNNKVVYETYTIPQPVNVNIQYKVVIKAQFQKQINDILTSFLVYSGQINGFTIGNSDHRYEAFFPETFDANNNVATMGDDEKMYETNFTIRVLGYLLNDNKNSDHLEIEKRQSIVKVRMPRERIMIGDEHPYADEGRFYKE